MSISALVPIAHLLAANAALEAAGHGPHNFSIPCYIGAGATHAALHCWDSPAFLASLQAIPQVTILADGDLDPSARTRQVVAEAGAQWGAEAAALPSAGTVAAGSLYRVDNDLWSVIQSFNRSVYGDHPSTYPALMRRVRNPLAVAAWQQPLDQYDAYRLVNPFTGQPDQANHNGHTWYVTGVDGAGNNVWAPGVFGWTVVGQEPEPGATWVDTGVTLAQLVGAGVYRVSAVLSGLTIGQALRLGATAETTFNGYWPTAGTPSDYIKITPHVSAAVGATVWKWA
jgi:hypothetical protein